jgi:choline dehydrogenase-like flavoprotein
MTDEFDVVVVGGGAGGPPVALTLARAGATVTLLDRGPRYTLQDFVHDEVRIARRDFFVPASGTDPHVVVAKGRPPRRSHDGWVASCLGGGTVHMSGFFYRFHPLDFRLRDALGSISGASLANWPISYEELQPYYAQVEREIGVSGGPDGSAWAPPRGSAYPLPPLDNHPAADLIDAAASRLGVTAFPTPRAIISRSYGGRSRCLYGHLCGGFGCEVGAKSSTLRTLIPAAEKTGKCRVIPKAMVLRINSAAGDRVSGVTYRDADGADHELRARVVVVACSAIESIRLLLLSDGLGNAEGQLGQHVMFSTLSKAHGSFHFRDDAGRARMLRDDAPFLGRSVLDYYMPRPGDGVQKGGALNFLFPPGGPIGQSIRVALRGSGLRWGRELKQALRFYWHEQKQIDCETFGEYLANPGTRVELDPDVRDRFGLPVARIVIDRHPHDAAVSRYLAERAAEILTEAGADRVWKSAIAGRTMHLPMGGCRMGNDPRSSVVDRLCRVHQRKNLFVSDGSVFVSSGGVPPTHTILANAFRVGVAIRDGFVRRDW